MRKSYSYEFKLKADVLNFMQQTVASHQETANEIKMVNPNLIGYWLRVFREDGLEALSRKSGGAIMSKIETKKTYQVKKKLSREKQLERDNKLLRLEISYLKKFNTFQKDPNQSLKEQIKTLFSEFKERYGYKRITTELNRLGYCVNHKKVYYEDPGV